jgi:hypothetical protein
MVDLLKFLVFERSAVSNVATPVYNLLYDSMFFSALLRTTTNSIKQQLLFVNKFEIIGLPRNNLLISKQQVNWTQWQRSHLNSPDLVPAWRSAAHRDNLK